ncbi:uncharacterized protein LOC117789403 [Drosophila innubila]|uniref:uncharacterized protein LOC117789403 n=1 Tax=Drosophila innubila TaxID=198719 RepID=UPI00148E0366|nr:uncharacterized protein LOC117789403 [Drosophila innubila]
MLEYIRFLLTLVFVAGLSSCEKYNCFTSDYSDTKHTDMEIKCREGCTGIVPNCKPHCAKCPMNSKCTKPNFCECDSGYRKRNETELNMVPYQKLTDLQSCIPICNEGYTVVVNSNGTVGSCTN